LKEVKWIIGLGEKVHAKSQETMGINATLINPRFITGIDEEKMLTELLADHKLVITLEDGLLDGGFGEKIARLYGRTLRCNERVY
jgi:1-deoxy-D-xylulose-5-phosphate synthase